MDETQKMDVAVYRMVEAGIPLIDIAKAAGLTKRQIQKHYWNERGRLRQIEIATENKRWERHLSYDRLDIDPNLTWRPGWVETQIPKPSVIGDPELG